MSHLSDQSYLAIKKEAVAGVAVKPNTFIPLVSESIKTVVNHEVDRRMRGVDWKGTNLVRGNRSHEGELKVLGDPDTIGYFLDMLMVKGSSTGSSADGYTHPFTVGTGNTYTIEIKKGNYAQRYFGVRIDELHLEFEDGQLVVTAQIKAMGQVSVMSLGANLSGASTSLTLADTYDIAPNNGLVVGDVLTVGGVDVTLTSVNSNGVSVSYSSTSITASIGDPVLLKPQTVSQPTLQDPFYFGNVLAGFGATESAATTAAGSRSTATPIYDLSIVFKTNLFAQNGSNRLDPVQIIPRTKEASINLKQLFESVDQRQKFLNRTKQALTLVFLGKFIKSDFTTQEKLTLKFNNVRMLEHNNAVEVGELIADDQHFEALYDTTDGVAMSAVLVNRTATY
jgi:hypothetical protein